MTVLGNKLEKLKTTTGSKISKKDEEITTLKIEKKLANNELVKDKSNGKKIQGKGKVITEAS